MVAADVDRVETRLQVTELGGETDRAYPGGWHDVARVDRSVRLEERPIVGGHPSVSSTCNASTADHGLLCALTMRGLGRVDRPRGAGRPARSTGRP